MIINLFVCRYFYPKFPPILLKIFSGFQSTSLPSIILVPFVWISTNPFCFKNSIPAVFSDEITALSILEYLTFINSIPSSIVSANINPSSKPGK